MRLTKDKAQEILDAILQEMFKRVNRDYDRDYCRKQDWYTTSQWTEAEQDDWLQWGAKYMRDFHGFSKKQAEEQMMWINLTYGWQLSRKPEMRDKEYEADWSKTYHASGTVRVTAASYKEAQEKVENMMGDLEGSMQYIPECDTVEAIREV